MANEDVLLKINQLRQRVIAGEEISIEESKEAIKLLRQFRAEKTGPKEVKGSSLPADLNELFADKSKEG